MAYFQERFIASLRMTTVLYVDITDIRFKATILSYSG